MEKLQALGKFGRISRVVEKPQLLLYNVGIRFS